MGGIVVWVSLLLLIQSCINPQASSPEKVSDVTGTTRSNVTLQLDQDMEQKKDILWVRVGGTHFATTKPNALITIRDLYYSGRLVSLADGSLRITNLTMEDQGIYRASVRLVGDSTRVQMFNLSIIDKGDDPSDQGSADGHTNKYCFLKILAALLIWAMLD